MRKKRALIEIVIITLIGMVLLRGETDRPERWLKITVITDTPNDDLGPVWSPDGQRIAFVGHHEGNPEIYVLDVSSGTLTNLTHSPLDDYDPRWSPDGQYIFFRQRGYDSRDVKDSSQSFLKNQVIMEVATGTSVELPATFGDFLKWSDDSRQLIFRVADSRCYATYEVPSRQYWQSACLVGTSDADLMSPDYRYWVVPHGMTDWDVFDTQTGEVTQMHVNNSIGYISWSPDSRFVTYLALSDTHTLNSYDRLTGNTTELYTWASHDSLHVDWSPDGQLAWSIIFRPDLSAKNPGWRADFYAVKLSGSVPPEVRLVGSINLNYIQEIKWSPVGRYLGVRSYAGIYVLDTQTGMFYNLIYGRDQIGDFHWSPDGRFITAALSSNKYQPSHRAAIAKLHTGQVMLLDNVWEQSFRWLPDGSRLVMVCGIYPPAGNLCLGEFPDP
jgi:Tol biopolymer transport system component